ncbi:MAG: SH3 domain-containing protein [Gammaproteobacteria bacterium]|nr:SH3 domain-containing protein [Gammaproteobacteria bacterium]
MGIMASTPVVLIALSESEVSLASMWIESNRSIVEPQAATAKKEAVPQSYQLVKVIESTRGCADHQQYKSWLPCLRNGERFSEGDVLLLILNGTVEEGAVVQRQNSGDGYGPRYVTPPQWLRPLEPDPKSQDSRATAEAEPYSEPRSSTTAWNELQVGETYQLRAEETPLMPGLTLNVEGDDVMADFRKVRYLPAGEIVHVLTVDTETRILPWYQVRVESRNGLKGWINSSVLIREGVTHLSAD